MHALRLALAMTLAAAAQAQVVEVDAPPVAGPFEPTWASLAQHEVPDWFRDAKFGIWAHWGPQCAPEAGDWYAKHLYVDGHWQNKLHRAQYGDPATVGFKDVIHSWKAEKFDPDALVAFYKASGARYFFALANHHDNFDLWASKHQPWNATRIGPKRDLIAGWAKAARANGLPFGVSVHSAHAWTWYEPSQDGDGNLTAADGRGTWWDGLDPQRLYAQNHPRSRRNPDGSAPHGQWEWGNGASVPDRAYCQDFFDRTADLIDQHQPDLIYFDDTVLPLHPVSDAGLKLAARFYNATAAKGGVLFGKVLATDEQKRAITWDVERGAPPTAQPIPWQTCTCLGEWHYDRGVFDRKGYKTATTVVRTLADVVSKNGNLLLSVPVKGDGTIDAECRAIVEAVGRWLETNGEAIYATRPFDTFGEGPTADDAPAMQGPGFNEGHVKPYTAADVRYTQKGDAVYALVMAPPAGPVRLRALAGRDVKRVTVLGGGEAKFAREPDALVLTPPAGLQGDLPVAFKIQ